VRLFADLLRDFVSFPFFCFFDELLKDFSDFSDLPDLSDFPDFADFTDLRDGDLIAFFTFFTIDSDFLGDLCVESWVERVDLDERDREESEARWR
jgi:hypothetical protein